MSNATATKVPADEDESPALKLVDSEGTIAPGSPKPDSAAASTGALEAPEKLLVRLSSLGVTLLDEFSLSRVFRREFRNRTAFFRSAEGGNFTLEDAVEKAVREMSSQNGDELMVRLLTADTDSISFKDLLDLWSHSQEDAEFIWTQMKLESRRELMSGHLAASVFEPVDWMRSAPKRALFLGVRDSFLDEYEPEGGVEIALVDLMAQTYFLQLHWTEEAVKRTRTEPDRQNEAFLAWLKFKYEQETGWDEIFDPGTWERLRVSEFECQEQALKLADHFSRLFLRIVRQMDNHRLSKAKLRRLSLPRTTSSVLESERENVERYMKKLQEARSKAHESSA